MIKTIYITGSDCAAKEKIKKDILRCTKNCIVFDCSEAYCCGDYKEIVAARLNEIINSDVVVGILTSNKNLGQVIYDCSIAKLHKKPIVIFDLAKVYNYKLYNLSDIVVFSENGLIKYLISKIGQA